MIRKIEREPIKYEEFWVVRVIRANIHNGYECVGERTFDTPPTQEEIVNVLMDNASDCFVSVEHNYKLVNGADAKYISF